MILADTSIWIDHLSATNAKLAHLLDTAQILMHPFVIGELALGNLRPRGSTLADLSGLPRVQSATHAEVLDFVNRYALFGQGLGYVDAHLLAAVRLTADATLWTRDRRLRAAASRFGLAADM